MLRFRLYLHIALLCLGAQAVFAQQFWETKPYQKWSKAETEKMLSDSPWAQHISLSKPGIQGTNPRAFASIAGTQRAAGAQTSAAEAEHQDAPHLTYTLQLRSAMPVRRAVARSLQLEKGYDSMNAEQKAVLDGKINAYLLQPQEEVVVYVAYTSNVGNYVDSLRRYWTLQTYDLLKNSVYLIAGKQRLQLSGYGATNGAFQFNFPRPASLDEDDSIAVEFYHPDIGLIASERILIEFKLKKMLLEGRPVM